MWLRRVERLAPWAFMAVALAVLAAGVFLNVLALRSWNEAAEAEALPHAAAMQAVQVADRCVTHMDRLMVATYGVFIPRVEVADGAVLRTVQP